MACVERIEHIPLTPEEEAKLHSLALTVSSNPHRPYSQGTRLSLPRPSLCCSFCVPPSLPLSEAPVNAGLCVYCGISTSVSLSPQGEGASGERSSPSQPIVCASCSVARRHQSPYTMAEANNTSPPSRLEGGVQNYGSVNHYAPPAPTQHPGVHPPSSSGGGGGGLLLPLGVHSPPPPQSPDYGAYWAM
jgi:hypothetical protein